MRVVDVMITADGRTIAQIAAECQKFPGGEGIKANVLSMYLNRDPDKARPIGLRHLQVLAQVLGSDPRTLMTDVPNDTVIDAVTEVARATEASPPSGVRLLPPAKPAPDYTLAEAAGLEVYEDVSEAADRHEIFVLPYAVAADANPAHIDRSHSEGSVWLPHRRGRRLGAKVYALRVSGESMNQIISNGDLCFVRNTSRAKDGDIVVLAQDGSITVKRLKGRQAVSESDRHFPPIQLYDSEDDASGNRIVGVVWGLHKPK